jgi:hypothetical protein
MADDAVEAVIALDMDTGGGLLRTHPALLGLAGLAAVQGL